MTHEEFVKRHCDWMPEAFDAFWEAYPRKCFKVTAMRAWDDLQLPEHEIPEMMRYLEECKNSRKWRRIDDVDLPKSFLYDQEWVK